MQFTCVTCSLPVKTGNYTCFYASSTSRRIHAIALDKSSQVARNFTCMMQANLPAICRWIYPRCDSRLPAIAGNSAWSCRFFSCDFAGFFPAFAVIFACVWRVFFPAIPVFLPVSCMYFCLQKQAILHASRGQICMSSACKTTCKMLVVFS